MILLEKQIGMSRAADEVMAALPDLRPLLAFGHEARLRAFVFRRPRLPAVLGAEHARRRDRHVHPVGVCRVREDAVHHEAARAWRPVLARRVVVEAVHRRPGRPAILAFEQRPRVHAGPHFAGPRGVPRLHAPDALDRAADLFGKRRAVGHLPRLAQVIRAVDVRAVHVVIQRGEKPARTALPLVEGQVVDTPSGEVRPAEFPVFARAVALEDERALARADEDEHARFTFARGRLRLGAPGRAGF